MRHFKSNIIFLLFLLGILFAGGIPAQSEFGGPWAEDMSYVECVADGNDTHTAATLINRTAVIYDTVCETDTHDWYMLPLQGDVKWGGIFTCFADGPGLRVALYVDTGAGPDLIVEDSPVLVTMGDTETYKLEWDLLDVAAGLGLVAAQPGNYYIRVTYYTYHPGNHPYSAWLDMWPENFNPSPYDVPGTARTLVPGMIHYGHLSGSDYTDWFTYTIDPGQTSEGVIFAEDVRVPGEMVQIKLEVEVAVGDLHDDPPAPRIIEEVTSFSMRVYSSDMTLLGEVGLPRWSHRAVDLQYVGPLGAGTYYIEVINDWLIVPTDYEAYYRIFNHALAPDTGGWTEDANYDTASAEVFTEGVPVSGSVWYPRDKSDYFSFTSPGYFLGDVKVEPSLDFMYLHASFTNDLGYSVGGRWIPGLGVTCRTMPRLPGDYFFAIADNYRLFYPTDYTATFYQHGVPLTGPTGHATWETAVDMTPEEKGAYWEDADVSMDLAPGIQEVFYGTLEVPADNILVGYYNIFGSRDDYRVRFGKLGPAGVPVWSPARFPDSLGKIHVNLNYEFLSDAGTYFIEVQMLQSSPGQLRVFISNESALAECEPDTNNYYSEAWDISSYYHGDGYSIKGRVCPGEDDVDWYRFDSGYFDDTKGPKKNLLLVGASAGMRFELYDGNLNFLRDGELTEMGGSAVIDLDGAIVPVWEYYIKVIAEPTEERVQVYEVSLRNDWLLVRPMVELQFLQEIRYPLLRRDLDLP